MHLLRKVNADGNYLLLRPLSSNTKIIALSDEVNLLMQCAKWCVILITSDYLRVGYCPIKIKSSPNSRKCYSHLYHDLEGFECLVAIL